jgi:mannose/fructose/N-acetylgalactosamine-specific phosphotransferase system component IIC
MLEFPRTSVLVLALVLALALAPMPAYFYFQALEVSLSRAQFQAQIALALGVALEVSLGVARGVVVLVAADFDLVLDKANLGSVKLRLHLRGLVWPFCGAVVVVVVFVLRANLRSCACWSRL